MICFVCSCMKTVYLLWSDSVNLFWKGEVAEGSFLRGGVSCGESSELKKKGEWKEAVSLPGNKKKI